MTGHVVGLPGYFKSPAGDELGRGFKFKEDSHMRGLGVAPQQQFPGGDSYAAKNSFVYLTSIAAALAAAGSTSSSFNIDGDSDFFWSKLNVYAQVASDGTTIDTEQLAGVTIVITNTTSGRQYMNTAVPLPLIAGNGKLPFILPMQTFFPAKATITVDYANITDNTTYSQLFLGFVGIKAFIRG